MKRLTHSLVAVATLVIVAGAALATPATSLMAGLRTTLAARVVILAPLTDPASVLQHTALTAAIRYIDKGKPKSLAGDLGVLVKIAGALDPTFIANDADVTAVLQTAVAIVDANVQLLDAREDGILDAKLEAKADKAVVDATALVDAAKLPTTTTNTVAVRVAALRDAQAIVEKTDAKIDKGSKCSGYGQVRLKIDHADFAPKFASATARKSAAGALEYVSVQGYFYDKRNPADPYHAGQIDLGFNGPDFHGVGTYTIGAGGGLSFSLREETTQWTFVSGTVIVTEYDEALRRMGGSFNGTVSDGVSTRTITEGRFRVCKLIIDTQ